MFLVCHLGCLFSIIGLCTEEIWHEDSEQAEPA
jgi:hypothetical protein